MARLDRAGVRSGHSIQLLPGRVERGLRPNQVAFGGDYVGRVRPPCQPRLVGFGALER